MVIIGARGLAKELLAVFHWNKYGEELFLFDNVNEDAPDKLFGRFPVLKSWTALEEHFRIFSRDYVLGVGGSRNRVSLEQKVRSLGGHLCSVLSNHALVGPYGNIIGDGVGILPFATVTGDAVIGRGTLINKSATVSHDARVGVFCEISPGARILGRTTVGDRCEIGSNAVILPDVVVGADCKIGAGAVVTKDVPDGSTVVGIPAKPIQRGVVA